MSNYILIGITVVLLIISFIKSREKTKLALKKALKAFLNIGVELVTIVLVVGILLAFTSTETISKYIGEDSGVFGIMIAAVVGSITLIPGFVAFPLAQMVLEAGAGYTQIATFVSALMMVGIVTIPLEIKYFGKELTFKRNGIAFIAAIVIGVIMGVLL
jgi:uncharacterized membrane protein YraQ (UPF0718 family)